MKHLCALIVYRNFEDVKLCFESIKNVPIDFFIIENCSDRSEEIYEYFSQQKLVGYIRFNKNIAANALRIWYKDYSELIRKYDLITISDSDFFVYDSPSMFEEIKQNLNINNILVSSATLYQKNHYSRKDNAIHDVLKYTEEMQKRNVQNGHELRNTAVNFITLTTENYFKLFTDFSKPILDVDINSLVKAQNGEWARTVNNLIYHLTWDRYNENDEYWEFKKDFCKKGKWRSVESCDYINLGEKNHG